MTANVLVFPSDGLLALKLNGSSVELLQDIYNRSTPADILAIPCWRVVVFSSSVYLSRFYSEIMR